MSTILITHDLGVIAQLCDKVAVMYAGTVVEFGDAMSVFNEPKHPYTRALLSSIPRLDRDNRDLAPIQGMVPAIDAMPVGCRFAPRCAQVQERCRVEVPEQTLDGDRRYACWFPIELTAKVAPSGG